MPAQVGPAAADMPPANPPGFVARWHVLRDQLVEGPAFDGDVDVAPIDFAGALVAVRLGHHITRTKWIARGKFVMWQAGYPHGIPVNQNTAEATGFEQATMCAIEPYLQLCLGNTGPGGMPKFANWTPNMLDILANDWHVMPKGTLTRPVEPIRPVEP